GDKGLCEIAEERHLLEKLDLCQCPRVSNNRLIAIVANCRNLTVLSIESCPKIGNEGLQAIEKLCPSCNPSLSMIAHLLGIMEFHACCHQHLSSFQKLSYMV
ncbi:hypothetical protein Godav_004033, partial [Gossypium davidsonii]|nr:hypothetical protein [Gossypium davidsonii]